MGSKKDPGAGLRTQAQANLQRAVSGLEKIALPDVSKMELSPEELALQELLEAEEMEKTALADIDVDPRLRDAQMEALRGLQERAETGLTEAEKREFEQMQQSVSAEDQARQASILQSMAQRGALGGGGELAARLASQQGATQRASDQASGLAARASDARLAALQQAGQLGGNIRGQEFGEQSTVAGAKDAIAQFNLMNRQRARERNVGERQRISESNVGQRNVAQQYNKELAQRQFQNEMARQGAIANAYTQSAQMLSNQAGQMKPKKGWGGVIGTAVGAGIGSMTGTGAAGAQTGAAIGGTIGSQFADGGIVHAEDGVNVLSGGNRGTRQSMVQDAAINRGRDGQPLPMVGEYLSRLLGDNRQTDVRDANFDVNAMSRGPQLETGLRQTPERQRQLNAAGSGTLDEAPIAETPAPKEEPKTEEASEKKTPKDKEKDVSWGDAAKTIANVLGKQEEDKGPKAAPVALKNPYTGQGQGYQFRPVFDNGGLVLGDNTMQEGGVVKDNWLDKLEPIGGESEYDNILNSLERLREKPSDENPYPDMLDDQGYPIQEEDQRYRLDGYHRAEDGAVVSENEGMVFPGEEFAGDRVDAKVNSGEMVLNLEQQQRLLDLLRGEEYPEEVIENGEDVVGYPEDMDDDGDTEAQKRGFLKILEMIGNKR